MVDVDVSDDNDRKSDVATLILVNLAERRLNLLFCCARTLLYLIPIITITIIFLSVLLFIVSPFYLFSCCFLNFLSFSSSFSFFTCTSHFLLSCPSGPEMKIYHVSWLPLLIKLVFIIGYFTIKFHYWIFYQFYRFSFLKLEILQQR